MRSWSALVCPVILFAIGIGVAAEIADTGITFPARYEGGSLPLSQGRIQATIVADEVVFFTGNQRFAIPLQDITAVTYGTDFHRKSLLRFVPFCEVDKAHYVGLTWTGSARLGEPASHTKIEAVLKLGEGKYKLFVSAIERRTGIKAVNADRLPAFVRF
jgi:hypothetical protein